MCGIAGSTDLTTGWTYYQNNLKRGYYSSSITVIGNDGVSIIKKLGLLDFEKIPKNGIYYLFHSRGPTVETNEFKWDENHPFIYGRFIVAHNGIIENYKALSPEKFTVDSQIIPFLINQEVSKGIPTKDAIKLALEKLEGTFGCWILDTVEWNIYLINYDVTLFKKDLDFSSSIGDNGLDVARQGVLYFINPKAKKIENIYSLTFTKKPKYFIPCPTS